ncbi:MAG: hypothetical protein R3D66_00870 [Alphaproteobacteria bacterium]
MPALTAALVSSIMLSGCGPNGTRILNNAEYFQYTFKIAEKVANDSFRIPLCNGQHLDASMDAIEQMIQTGNSTLTDCAQSFAVSVDARRAEGLVEVETHGNPATTQSDLEIRLANPATAPTTTIPTSIFLRGTGPLQTGPLPGFADLSFGTAAQDVFSTQQNQGAPHFFAHKMLSLSSTRVSGNFSLIAKNINNANDDRVLIVTDGTYLLDVD